ncbi:MAG: hypothetical protein ACMUIS_04525 [bacterium]
MKKKIISRIESVILLFIILLLIAGCGDGRDLIVKDGLEGVWKTSHATYKDCSLGLTKDLIIFASGYNLEVLDAFLLKHIEVNFITSVKKKMERVEKGKEKEGTKVLYTVCYENMNKQECTFPFYLETSDEGMITFKNQPQMKWTKEGTMIIKQQPERPK